MLQGVATGNVREEKKAGVPAAWWSAAGRCSGGTGGSVRGAPMKARVLPTSCVWWNPAKRRCGQNVQWHARASKPGQWYAVGV